MNDALNIMSIRVQEYNNMKKRLKILSVLIMII